MSLKLCYCDPTSVHSVYVRFAPRSDFIHIHLTLGNSMSNPFMCNSDYSPCPSSLCAVSVTNIRCLYVRPVQLKWGSVAVPNINFYFFSAINTIVFVFV